ncbi:uncharacterized protein O3C94_019941 [Discoglossus pictus]
MLRVFLCVVSCWILFPLVSRWVFHTPGHGGGSHLISGYDSHVNIIPPAGDGHKRGASRSCLTQISSPIEQDKNSDLLTPQHLIDCSDTDRAARHRPRSSLCLCALLAVLPPLSSTSLCPSLCFCDSRSLYVNCSARNLSHLLVFPPMDTVFLDVSGCSLHSLPSLPTLWRLQTLLAAENHISEVGTRAWRGMRSLQSLDLSWNCLVDLGVSFSWGLESLTHLSLAHNALGRVHGSCFQQLSSLEVLDLQGNLIISLDPGALKTLIQLRRLQLQNNLMQSLRSDDFSVLQRLQVLDLSGNQIQALPPGVFSSLHSLNFLNLQHNQLHHLRFQTLRSLPAPGTLLLLSHNPWQCDCDLQRVFGKLEGVQRLSLQDGEEVRCAEPPALRGRLLTSLDMPLCVAETVTVLVITLTIAVTVVGAIVAGERSRKSGRRSQENELCVQD